MIVAGGGPALPLLAGARVRVDGAPPGDGSGRRVRRLWLRRRRRVLGLRGADRGEVTVVVVGHGHVMHVAAKAVVVAVGEGERVEDLTS